MADPTRFLKKLAEGIPQTMVVYGTSLTEGGAWVRLLQEWLQQTYPGALTLINSGMGGKASNTALDNLESKVLSHRPDVVWMEFAMNDAYRGYTEADRDHGITLEQSVRNLNGLLDRTLEKNPDVEIILQIMNTVWDAPSGFRAASLRPELAAYYQGYRDVAQMRGLLLIDHQPEWLAVQARSPETYRDYMPDGVHPNELGEQTILFPLIQSSLVKG
jgi:lysophospholipase L1-like esterase